MRGTYAGRGEDGRGTYAEVPPARPTRAVPPRPASPLPRSVRRAQDLAMRELPGPMRRRQAKAIARGVRTLRRIGLA